LEHFYLDAVTKNNTFKHILHDVPEAKASTKYCRVFLKTQRSTFCVLFHKTWPSENTRTRWLFTKNSPQALSRQTLTIKVL